MPFIAISDDLKRLLDEHKHLIKDDYKTYKLFADSAIRQKLRSMGIDAGTDEVIAHLEELDKNKSRHLDRQHLKKIKTRHKLRVARAKRRLQNID